jgi:hypothetical protein
MTKGQYAMQTAGAFLPLLKPSRYKSAWGGRAVPLAARSTDPETAYPDLAQTSSLVLWWRTVAVPAPISASRLKQDKKPSGQLGAP